MDINKEFEKLAEKFEKEWHDGHEPQGIDDQYVEEMEDGEEIEEASKPAIQSFGKKLSDYAKKRGGIDKDDFKFIAKEAIGGHLPNPKSLNRMDTEPREVVLDLMGKEFGRKFVEKEYGIKFNRPTGYKEEVEIDEKKSATGYELYHKTFSDAMQHAYAHAKSKGFVVDPKEIDDKVATGPKKPSSGKTNRYSLKAGRKKVEIQVANLDNKRYELNMYIEGVELKEGELAGDYKKLDKLQSEIRALMDKGKDPRGEPLKSLIKKADALTDKLYRREDVELEEENKYDMFDDKPAQELDKEMKKAMKMKSYEVARAHIGDFLIKLDKKYPKSGAADTEPRSIATDLSLIHI